MTELSIGEALTWWAQRDPVGVAVVCGEERLTRAELDDRAERLARRWAADGVVHDDLVTVCLPSGIDAVVACAAAWKAGATPQPLSPTMPAAERARLIELGRPRVVVDGPLPERSTDDAGRPAPAYPPREPASSWKVATSSGSTGTPKLIRATAAARIDPQRDTTTFLPAATPDRPQVQLVAAPLTHGAPFVYAMRGLMTGHTLVLMPRFEPAAWLRLVAEHRVTWAMVVPTMMHRIWREPGRAEADVSSLGTVLHLGAACAPDLKRSWLDWLGPERVVEVYAGTESSGIAVIDGVEWLAHPGSVGRAGGDTTFRVVRADGTDAEPDEPGEVLMRRGRATFDYVGLPPRRGLREGWHSLGDLGHLDTEGYLHLHGRLDDVITRGGVSILPAPIEAALEEHPDVRSALVVGVADDDLGQEVLGVVDDAGVGLDSGQLAAWLRDRVDAEHLPHAWRVVDQPLRDDAGKARRRDWAR